MLPVLRQNRAVPAGWDFLGVSREFDRLLGNGFGSLTGWSPATDIRETEEEFIVSAELPGLTAKDVEVSVKDGVLAITGEKKEEFEDGGESSGRQVIERRFGKFERSFSLPRGVNAAKVNAKFVDGLLSVVLPKAATAKPRQIKISAN